jgi:response regulator RpfG family c-di-GMP phosphodiesterase
MVYGTNGPKAIDKAEALRVLRENAGTRFDPQLLEQFAVWLIKRLNKAYIAPLSP